MLVISPHFNMFRFTFLSVSDDVEKIFTYFFPHFFFIVGKYLRNSTVRVCAMRVFFSVVHGNRTRTSQQ